MRDTRLFIVLKNDDAARPREGVERHNPQREMRRVYMTRIQGHDKDFVKADAVLRETSAATPPPIRLCL
jgi:hypothetical protein